MDVGTDPFGACVGAAADDEDGAGGPPQAASSMVSTAIAHNKTNGRRRCRVVWVFRMGSVLLFKKHDFHTTVQHDDMLLWPLEGDSVTEQAFMTGRNLLMTLLTSVIRIGWKKKRAN